MEPLEQTWDLKPGERRPRPQAHVLSALSPNLAILTPDPRRLQDEPVTPALHTCIFVYASRACSVGLSLSVPHVQSVTESGCFTDSEAHPSREGCPTTCLVQALGGGRVSATTHHPPRAAHSSGRDRGRGDASRRHLGQEQGTLCLGDPSGRHQPVPLPPVWADGQTQEEEAANQKRAGGPAGRGQVGILASGLSEGMPFLAVFP